MSRNVSLPILQIGVLFAAFSIAAMAAASQSDEKKSAEYFVKMTKVLQHPRCLNCHPKGDFPLQGLDMHAHIMNVKRGKDDHGFVGMRCSTCHGIKNNPDSHVPGAPKWGLAPKSMAWVGLSKRELCLAIKDPEKNHHMSLQQLIEHNGKDELVGWAWNPGDQREPAPGTQKEFGELTKRWVDSGAHCPD